MLNRLLKPRPFNFFVFDTFLTMPIPQRNVLEEMRRLENGAPKRFSIEVISADQKKGVAGKVLLLENVHLSGIKKLSIRKNHERKLQAVLGSKKDPAHNENLTLNIYDPLTQKITKVHIDLIAKFNGQAVL